MLVILVYHLDVFPSDVHGIVRLEDDLAFPGIRRAMQPRSFLVAMQRVVFLELDRAFHHDNR